MLKLFDNNFFKFFFGFVGILFGSLIILMATQFLGGREAITPAELPQQAAQGQ